MTEPRVEAEDRALETARKCWKRFHSDYCDCDVVEDVDVRQINDVADLIQSAMNANSEALKREWFTKGLTEARTQMSALKSQIPMVLRATGRTIPDLTKREHVCEYQCAIRGKAESAMNAQEREPLDLLKRFVRRFSIKPSSDVCTVCKCRFEHSSDCLVAEAERLLAERGEGR